MHTVRRIGSIWAAESAVIVGDVTIGEDSNFWHHVMIRGDVAPIHIGARVNVQDQAILHCRHSIPLLIADEACIAHGAVVHCHKVGSRTLIGTRATLLDDCEVGDDCLIAAGALLVPRTRVPDGSVVMGAPGKVVREIREEERAYIRRVTQTYLDLARKHAAGEYRPYGE